MAGLTDIVADWGADPTGKTSASSAFHDCLNDSAVQVCQLPPASIFLIDKRLDVPAGKSLWCPGGGRATFLVKGDGLRRPLGILLQGSNPGLHGIYLRPYSAAETGKYDGIALDGTTNAVLRDVSILYPYIGLKLYRGQSDWGDIQISVKWFYHTGIDFSTKTGPLTLAAPGPELSTATAFSNNNVIRILDEIAGNPNERLGDDPKLWWPSGDTYGIRLHGTVNTVIGGEISVAKWAIDDQGTQNRWIGQYVEQCDSIKVGRGTHYFDCHLALDSLPSVNAEAVVLGQSGLAYSAYNHFPHTQVSSSELTALWYFDEVVNRRVLDHSGRGMHVPVAKSSAGPLPDLESPYGKAFRHTPFHSISDLPLEACRWDQPFTVVACFQMKLVDGGMSLLEWTRTEGYTRILPGPGSVHFQDYDKSKGWHELARASEIYATSGVGTDEAQRWCWLGVYVDPIQGKVKLLDTYVGDAKVHDFAIWGGLVKPERLQPFFKIDPSSSDEPMGGFTFLAFFQRELRLPEFVALVNQRTHWQPAPRSQVAMQTLELVAADGAGRRIEYATAAPKSGMSRRGDLVYNAEPSPGGTVGWVCTEGGTPGEWRAFGNIAS